MQLLPVSLALLGTAMAIPQWGGPGWGGPGGSSGQNSACSQAVIALATGIHLNIEGQYGEYNATLNVIAVESSTPVNMEAFYIAKGELMANVQAGMNLRLFNQQIAPPGNAAIPGLAKYQAAEETEKALAAGLTGNPATDKAALDSLKSDIMAGIKLNENNLADVSLMLTIMNDVVLMMIIGCRRLRLHSGLPSGR